MVNITDAEFAEAVACATNWAELIASLGLAHEIIKRVERLSLDVRHIEGSPGRLAALPLPRQFVLKYELGEVFPCTASASRVGSVKVYFSEQQQQPPS